MILRFVFPVLGFLIASVAAAQSQSSPPVLPKVQATAEPEFDSYGTEATRTATKTDTPLRDVPQSVSIIGRKQIEDQSIQNIGEAAAYVPGVGVAQGEGNRETLVIRGNSTTGDFFLDGMRDDVQYYRDLYNIEEVEVLKGPNGMIFGRGGVGGLVNRVSKEANWDITRQLTLQTGSHENKRLSADFGAGLTDSLAWRLNAMYEDSESYRDDVTLERYGVNPTMTVRAGERTRVVLGVEYFRDERTADRGVSAFNGRPLEVHNSSFFGDPAQSPSEATAKMINAAVEHRFSDSLVLRNRTRYADYDKFYQNVFPGAVDSTGTTVALSAYNNGTQRENVFNQTDLLLDLNAGGMRHQLLVGLELGRQVTDNLRNTGFFDSVALGATALSVPLSNPRTTLPVSFRPSATDADNHGTAQIVGLYLQDQLQLSDRLQAILGLRYDSFDMDLRNNRTGQTFRSDDGLLSPRVGLVYKPVEPLSLYASYSMSFQPRAGEQLASLSAANTALDPEEFENLEVGAKWDVLPGLGLTAAIYRLDRSKVAVNDPTDLNNPPRLILVDGHRVEGIEIGFTGEVTEAWSIIGSYAYQDGEIVSNQTATILEGARLAMLPENTFALWNRYDFTARWGLGLGFINRDEIFAATENLAVPTSNVTLPSYTRVDGAVFFAPSERIRAQLNVENLLGEDYFIFAHSNTNITPGSPRSARLAVHVQF